MVLAPLAHPDFRSLWIGRNLSRLGDSLYEVALGWTVYTVTGSSAAMGLVLASTTVLQVLFALCGGVVADRVSRRRLLLLTDAGAAMITGGLALVVASGHASLCLLVSAGAGLGIVSAFALPAIGPLLSKTVPADQLRAANALDSATFSLMSLLGPPLGGLIVTYSSAGAFAFDACTFATSFLALLLVRGQSDVATGGRNGWQNLGAGLRYVARSPWLKWLLCLSVVINVACIAPFSVLLPQRLATLHCAASSYGLVLAAQGSTSVLCSILAGHSRRVRRIGLLIVVATASPGIAALLLAVASDHVFLLAAGAMLGISTCGTTLQNYLIQSRVDSAYQSRVMSVVMLCSLALLPLGYAGVGLLASISGAPVVLVTGGGLGLFTCAVALCAPSLGRVRAPEVGHNAQEGSR
jgi:predicted MFS family arabinose efflux permease